MQKSVFYLSTTIPYVNADPHIGHALEFVQADAMVRYQRLLGKDVFFLAGSDENSLKNVQAAEKNGKKVEDFVAEKAGEFKRLKETLDISFTEFIRTTEPRHFLGAQALWKQCNPQDIYKKKYKGLYCVGCESYYTTDELMQGLCPEHKTEPQVIEEENYFFRLTQYQDQLRNLIESGKLRIVPEGKKNEMLAFINRGLEDFSISRSHERAHGWGVPVPGDEEQIMYVWFDALSNYINGLNFGSTDDQLFQKYWVQEGQTERQVVHVLGKGVARFHEVYWIAMLLSAQIPLPTEEFVHGYITVSGEKMSKSLQNVINPHDLVQQYGTDPVRYFMLGAISAFQDGDFSYEKFEEYYTAHMVNGLGNLTSRILVMLEKYNNGVVPSIATDLFDTQGCWKQYKEKMEGYAFHEAVKKIQSLINAVDLTISEQKPWELAKQGKDIQPLLYQLVESLRHIATMLLPIIPGTAISILRQLGMPDTELETVFTKTEWGGLQAGTAVKRDGILFDRLVKTL